MRKYIAGLLFFIAAAAPAFAQTGDLVEGEVRKVDKEAGKITLKHGPIPNLDMSAMTMVFRVKDPAMLDAVKPGDKVRFKADKVQGAITVTEIERASSAPDVVEIAWNSDGRFAHSAAIAPGKFVEVCGKVKKGEVIDWSFSAEKPVDFNIHYHLGDKVEFSEKRDAVGTLKARLTAPVDQDYCWMWTSKARAPLTVTLQLDRR